MDGVESTTNYTRIDKEVGSCDNVIFSDADGRRRYCRGNKCCISCIFTTLYIILILCAILTGMYIIDTYDGLPVPSNGTDPTPGVPGAPNPPRLSQKSAVKLCLEWNQPDYHENAITKYEIELKLASTNFSNYKIDTGINPFWCIRDLRPNTYYSGRVRAVNRLGPGVWSNMSTYQTQNASRPSPPGQPNLISVDQHSMTLVWGNSSNRGIRVSSYVVDMYVIRGVTGQGWNTVCTSSSNGCRVGGLQSNTMYLMRVKALTSSTDMTSSWSITSSFHTDKLTVTAPQPVEEIVISNQTEYSGVSVWWERPDDNGSEILGYRLQYTQSSSWETAVDIHISSKPPFSNDTTVLKLPPNHTFFLRMCAFNSNGSSVWGDSISFTTRPLPPPSETPELYLEDVTFESLKVTWANLSGVVLYTYQLQHDDWWLQKNLYNVYQGTATSYTSNRGLLPGSMYTFRARAINEGGVGPWGKSLTVSTNEKGGCGNVEDLLIFFNSKTTMKGDIQKCIIECITGGKQCVVDCIHDQVGLSVPCSRCWGEEATCTLKNCILPCTIPTSNSCTTCSRERCFPGCVTCSGVPEWAYPL